MANENALKVMFQKKAPACRVLAFENCFMGRTWSCSQITDKPGGRDGLPLNVQVDYVPFYDHSRPEESTAESLRVLRRHIARYPGQHAAMVFELVQGEGGIKPGTHDFFVTLMKELKEQGIAIFDDEVQTFGRTPELFAFKHFGLENYVDVVSIGKLSQVCATLYRSEFKPRPGLLSQTFTSSTTTVYAAKMMIQTLLDQGYYGKSGKISKLHDYFTSKLQEISDRHPDLIEGPYGVGAMIAFTPLGGDAKKVSRLTHALFEAGVICFTAGSSPARIRFLVPAAVVTHDDIDKVCKILEDTLIREGQVVTA